MTPEKMKELAVKKWEAIVEFHSNETNTGNPGGTEYAEKKHPELRNLENGYSYCAEYLWQIQGKVCLNCPVKINGLICDNPGHPYSDWSNSYTLQTAQAMLDHIKTIQP